MVHRFEANLSFGFRNSLVNTSRGKELKCAKTLKREVNEKASRYTHFELKTSLLMKMSSHGWLKTALYQ